MDNRVAVARVVISGGLFAGLSGFSLLAYSAVKTTAGSFSLENEVSSGARVGIVEAKGAIGETQTGVDADKIVRLLKKYEKDDDVKAVVLRGESPGGAVGPSQEVHDAVG